MKFHRLSCFALALASIAPLARADFFSPSTTSRAAQGAVFGAVVGALVGENSRAFHHDPVRGAIAGGLIGALIGALPPARDSYEVRGCYGSRRDFFSPSCESGSDYVAPSYFSPSCESRRSERQWNRDRENYDELVRRSAIQQRRDAENNRRHGIGW